MATDAPVDERPAAEEDDRCHLTSAVAGADELVPGIAAHDSSGLPRLLCDKLGPSEPAWKRRVFELLAVAIVLGYLCAILSYWSPASPGIDENGYLVGGKRIALTGSSGIKPDNPFQAIGGMWVMSGDPSAGQIWYYPKYPIGLPLLNAIPLWINWEHGKVWALYISPVCTSLALLAVFLFAREIAGSFMGILAMILLGTNYTTMYLANDPGSHGPALFFVTVGMYLLLRWWQTGAIWRGVLAGFLLGYAVTIRYTEGLLLLPLCAAALLTIRWRDRRTYLRAAVPLLAWLVPVLWLVGFNWFAMHSLTGYDTTNESTGFKLDRLTGNWAFTFEELYEYGTFLILPLALLGLMLMWRWSWRVALMITLWLVPASVVYTMYYWGSNVPGIGFLRFFQTLFPPIILAAVWFLRRGGWSGADESRRGAIAMPLASGALVAFAAAIGIRNAVPMIEMDSAIVRNLDYSCDAILQNVPQGSLLIVDQNAWMGGMLNFLPWRAEYELYPADAFRIMAILLRFQVDPNQPSPIQSARQKYAGLLYEKLNSDDLQKKQDELIEATLKQGRRAFCVLPVDAHARFFHRTINAGPQFEGRPVARWNEQLAVKSPLHEPLAPPERDWAWLYAPKNWQLTEIVYKNQISPGAQTTRPTTAASAASSNDRSNDRSGR